MRFDIPIFAAEKKEGLADLIRANASIAYCSPAKTVQKTERRELMDSVYSKTTAAANKGQCDLFYLDTILVTTGMNLNDDIFSNSATWAARHTPEDKPFNYGHEQMDIIGHITSNCAVDEEYNAIAEDSSIDDLPDKFHILTGAVIYRAWADEKQYKRIEKIIAEIEEDKWFVSMECLFRGFDYGLFNSQGECRIVARNEDTAFLTKHLRAYNGSGKYKGERIGRVISNLTFSGKGLVEKPANPESIIFNNTASFKSTFANLGYISSSEGEDESNLNNSEELNMADENKTIAELSEALKNAKAENAALVQKIEEGHAKAAKAAEDKITELTVAVEDEKKKVKEAEDKKAKAESDLAEANKVNETLKAESDKMKKEVDKSKKSEKVSKANLTDEEAEAFLADWADASEEVFDKALSLATKNSANAGSGSYEKPANVKKVAEIKFGDDGGAQRVNTASANDVLDDKNVDANAPGAAAAANTSNSENLRDKLSNFIEAKCKESKKKNRK